MANTTARNAMRLIALLCTALVFGLTLGHVLQSPGSRGLMGAEWLAVQHTFYGGFAIVGGAAEVVGLVTSAMLAISFLPRREFSAAIAPVISAVCMVGTLLVYWFGNRPVNVKISGWTNETLPADWSAYRNTWEISHALSCGLAAIAFLVLAIAIIWGSRRFKHDDR